MVCGYEYCDEIVDYGSIDHMVIAGVAYCSVGCAQSSRLHDGEDEEE